ncbi:MAG: cupin domain-containing protein [Anaerolineaceae bacterium]|nr:cupin domain-containing protein [Anaerolineaceae bacterium]
MSTPTHTVISPAEINTDNLSVPAQSILSRSLLENDKLKWMLFQFAEGQELSEHTASMPAIINILDGSFDCKIGEETLIAQPGTLIYMEPNTPHSLKAKKTASFYLMLLK